MSSAPRARTGSPFSRRYGNARRFGVPMPAFRKIDGDLPHSDSTLDALRGKFFDVERHDGHKETLEEKRFPWLKKRRQR